MKRGKEDEKLIQGPMFPRLHVKDTASKGGGPRAPPRNKMALYEQLTIPSHRHAPLAPISSSNSNTIPIPIPIPSTSTMHHLHEPNIYFPLYRPPLSDQVQLSRSGPPPPPPPLQQDTPKHPFEDDDFMVPIFSHPPINAPTHDRMHHDTHTHLAPPHPMALPSTGEKQTHLTNIGDLNPNHQFKNQHPKNSGLFDAHARYSSDNSMRENPYSRKDCAPSGYQDNYRMTSFNKTNAHLPQDRDTDLSEATNDVALSDQPLQNPPKDLNLGLGHSPHNMDGGMTRVEEYQSLEKESMDKGDDISETSMDDSVSGFDMNPDDVVRVIGRKHFWKARTAIANQQRVFAVQIFELHRLLKVQKLIAESPELLLEGSALLRRTSLKGSSLKKYSSEYAAEALVHKSVPKDDSHKETDKMEGTAENAVTKSPPIPPQNAIQPTAYQPSSVNTGSSFPPVNADPKMNPWSFHQPAPHQWLVPVMSPSEGLVYKPYPAHGCMGPVCGGCGPAGMTPMINPAYGMPNPHCQQGIGMPPGMNFGGQQGYFPPYGMPMPIMSPSMSGSTVEQLNQFSGPNPYGQTGQPAGTSVNYGSMQHQSSLNIPKQKNGPIAPAARSLPSKERELQGSTASSPSQRTQETGTVPFMEGRDALPLFPAAPTTRIPEDSPVEKPTRVIRVVPQKSTRESAARIFQSIQEERRQH